MKMLVKRGTFTPLRNDCKLLMDATHKEENVDMASFPVKTKD
jgi:hypothetical protein